MSSFAFITNKGKLLLVLRDDIPTIPNPNCWSLIGGTDEPGETPEETLFREIKEEVNLDQRPAKFLRREESRYRVGDVRWLYHIPVEDQDLEQIKLGNEGQKIDWFTIDELKQIQLTKSMTDTLAEREDELRKLLNPLDV